MRRQPSTSNLIIDHFGIHDLDYASIDAIRDEAPYQIASGPRFARKHLQTVMNPTS